MTFITWNICSLNNLDVTKKTLVLLRINLLPFLLEGESVLLCGQGPTLATPLSSTSDTKHAANVATVSASALVVSGSLSLGLFGVLIGSSLLPSGPASSVSVLSVLPSLVAGMTWDGDVSPLSW